MRGLDAARVILPQEQGLCEMIHPRLTERQATLVWGILTKFAGASAHPSCEIAFVQTQKEGCTEYRFQGHLGFGGKFWNDGGKWYITCYQEDETPERREIIRLVDQHFAEIRKEGAK